MALSKIDTVCKTNKRPYGSMYCDEVTSDGKRVDANEQE
jgi:ribosomal protein L34E